jgi:hypothetical protein
LRPLAGGGGGRPEPAPATRPASFDYIADLYYPSWLKFQPRFKQIKIRRSNFVSISKILICTNDNVSNFTDGHLKYLKFNGVLLSGMKIILKSLEFFCRT